MREASSTQWKPNYLTRSQYGAIIANDCAIVCENVLADSTSSAPSVGSRLSQGGVIIVTIRHVAEHAHVSITTVSHVINDTRPVSDELRTRVLTAIDELGYQPNRLARSLRNGKTHILGMIAPDSTNPYFAEVARGTEDASFEHGYSLILCNSDNNLEKELIYTGVLTELQVDGVLFVAAGGSAESIRALQEQHIPVVVVDRELLDLGVDSVLIDNTGGGFLATQHLLELGHRRIGCITGPSELTPSANRVIGYRQALEASQIPIDKNLIIKGDFQFSGGCHAARQLLEMANPPTAIFASNDLMAIGAISVAHNMKRQVPSELSIVGFDDIALASYSNPPLTTIAQPRHEIGITALEMLLERIREPNEPYQRRVMSTRLLARESTASPPNTRN